MSHDNVTVLLIHFVPHIYNIIVIITQISHSSGNKELLFFIHIGHSYSKCVTKKALSDSKHLNCLNVVKVYLMFLQEL